MTAAWAYRLGVAGVIGVAVSFGAVAGEVSRDQVAAALPQLEAYIQDAIDSDLVPGLAVAVVFEDEVVYAKGFGLREAGRPEVVTAETVFQIASLSKPISSTIVAAIVSDGTVTWDSRIADIDPSFKLFDAYPTEQVTISDLFTHRSGLPGTAGDDLEQLGYDRETILGQLHLVPASSSLRAGYSYSNFGFTQGAVAAAKAAGLGWEEAAETKLYRPLGMNSTSSRYIDFLARTNRAVLHVPHDDRWQPLVKRDPDAQAPAGGVSSNVLDLAQWMRLILANGAFDGEQLIEAAAIDQALQPVFPRGIHPMFDGPSFSGLGWGVIYGGQGEIWNHAGAFSAGARTVARLMPDDQLGIVVLTNGFPTGMPEAVAATFFDYVFEGESTRDWAGDWNGLYVSLFGPVNDAARMTYGTPPASASPALPLSAYVGTYANDFFGEAVVEEADGGLTARLGPDGQKVFPLRHFDRDLFVYYPYDETPDVPYALTFRVGPDQSAVQIVFDDLNGNGLGTFQRVLE